MCVVFSHWVTFFLGTLSCSVLVLSWAFLVPPRSCSFRPSSGSSLMPFHCSSLRSLLPFSSRFFCCSLRLLFSVCGSLSPFLGRSSSLPSPPLSLPASRSVCVHGCCVVALGELQCVAGWWLPVLYLGASLLL